MSKALEFSLDLFQLLHRAEIAFLSIVTSDFRNRQDLIFAIRLSFYLSIYSVFSLILHGSQFHQISLFVLISTLAHFVMKLFQQHFPKQTEAYMYTGLLFSCIYVLPTSEFYQLLFIVLVPNILLFQTSNWVASFIVYILNEFLLRTFCLVNILKYDQIEQIYIYSVIGGIVLIIQSVKLSLQKTCNLNLNERSSSVEIKKKKAYKKALEISHEYRNPLNYLMGNLEIIDNDLKNDYFDKKMITIRLRNAKEGSERLLYMINNFIDLEKIQGEGLEFNTVPMNTRFICERIWSLSSDIMKEKKLDARLNLSRTFPRVIQIDSQRVIQLIVNLLRSVADIQDEGSLHVYFNYIASTTPQTVQGNGENIVKEEIESRGQKSDVASIILDTEFNDIGESHNSLMKKSGERFVTTNPSLKDVISIGSLADFHSYHNKSKSTSNISVAFDLKSYHMLTLDSKTFMPDISQSMASKNSSEGKLKITIEANCVSYLTKQDIIKKLTALLNNSNNLPIIEDTKLIVAHRILQGLKATTNIEDSERGFIFNIEFQTSVPSQPRSLSLIQEPKSFISPKFFSMRNFDSHMLSAVIVDDVKYNREVTRLFLQRTGVNIIGEFESGKEVIDFYNQNYKNIDMITMDIEMPNMSGKEASANIRIFEQRNNL